MIKPYFIFEVTPHCNNNCLYCYNVWKQRVDYPHGELNLPQIKKLFGKLLKEITPQGITLTGGEPLLRPDILEIISFLKNKKIKIGIATNGILLNADMAKKLVESGVTYFEISLPSPGQKNYSLLCQNEKIREVRKAILNVKQYKVQLSASFIVTKMNLSDIEGVIDLCFAFSVDSLALNRFVPGGNGLNYISELLPTKQELQNVLSIADAKSKKDNFSINVTVPIENCLIDHRDFPNLNFGTCICGKKKWVIDPLGNLRTCEQNPIILGSLFECSFAKLARLESAKAFRNKNLKGNCRKCGQFMHCGGGCRFL